MGNETTKPEDFHPEFDPQFNHNSNSITNTNTYSNYNFDSQQFGQNMTDLDLPPISNFNMNNTTTNRTLSSINQQQSPILENLNSDTLNKKNNINNDQTNNNNNNNNNNNKDSESDTDDDGNEISMSQSESKQIDLSEIKKITKYKTKNLNTNLKNLKFNNNKNNNVIIIQNHTVNVSQQITVYSKTNNNDLYNNVFTGEPMNVCWVFWKDNVDILPRNRQKELALLLYSHMFQKMPKARRLFIRGDIEKTALRFLDMFGFLIRQVKTPNQEGLIKTLQGLGKRHVSWGVQNTYFEPMLTSLHASLSDHFTHTYTVRVKFSMEQLFTCAANVMTGKDLYSIFSQRYSNIQKLNFLDSLDQCLADDTGIEYLERFLIQSFCAELVYFHRTYKKFRGALSDKERYHIATTIVQDYLTPNSQNELNIKKYEIKDKVISKLKKIEKKKKKTGEIPNISVDIFDPIHKWVVATIKQNSWEKFKNTISSISVFKK